MEYKCSCPCCHTYLGTTNEPDRKFQLCIDCIKSYGVWGYTVENHIVISEIPDFEET